jgi:hypothetical protein
MAEIKSQHVLPIPGGTVVATVVKLSAATETISNWPRMSGAALAVKQVKRSGDPTVTVAQASINSVTLTGRVGDECLVISHSDRPVVNPVA